MSYAGQRMFSRGMVLLLLIGCGSGTTNDSSGLDGSKNLIDLTDAEKGQFCDWAVNKFGGYGATCDQDWAFMRYPDRESCIKDASSRTNTPKCQSTVSDAEACVNAVSRCTTFEMLKSTPNCANLTTC